MGPRLLLLYPPLLFLFIFACLSPTSDASPIKPRQRQYLPPLPGYIPVYIQDGETPPDVESLSDAVDQSPTQDKMDTDVVEVPQKTDPEDSLDDADSGLRALRESEEFIVQQLTDNIRDNEVRGLVEEVHGPRS